MNFFLALAFLLFSCALKTDGKKKPASADLPDKRPVDITITYSENGGMLNISERIFISKDSSFYEKNKYGNIARVNFDTDDNTLEMIYTTFLENDFDEITSYSEKVYDRGGSSISVAFGDTKITKSNSGVNFIEEKWKDEYSKVAGVINRIAIEQWLNKSRDFTVIVDKSVKDEDGYIIFDDVNVYGNDDAGNHKRNEKGEIVNVLKLVEGDYNLNYNYRNGYSASGIKIRGHKGIRIYSDNGKLAWDYF